MTEFRNCEPEGPVLLTHRPKPQETAAVWAKHGKRTLHSGSFAATLLGLRITWTLAVLHALTAR